MNLFFDNSKVFFKFEIFFIKKALLLYGENNILYYCRVSRNNDLQKSEWEKALLGFYFIVVVSEDNRIF